MENADQLEFPQNRSSSKETHVLRKLYIGIVCFFVLVSAGMAKADSITFLTPAGSSTSGGAVDAKALFTTGDGTLSIELTNLLANPRNVAELISGLGFTLTNGATSGTLASSSAQQITINEDGSYTLGSTGSTGWGLNDNVSGGLQLDALGYSGPKGLIIGPGPYTNANRSIAGNRSHNPFLNGSANFLLNIAGVTVNTDITSATFYFGTTCGISVDGTPQVPMVPEPSPLLLLGTGMILLVLLYKHKFGAEMIQ